MFIVTNREVDEDRKDVKAFGSRVNALGPNELRLAEVTRVGKKWRIEVLKDEITPAMAKEVGLVPEIVPRTKEPKPIYASRYVARKVLARVNPAMVGRRAKGRNLVFFVHGFNNDVEAVIDRAEQLEQNYGVEVIPFTWPANGGGVSGVASYKSDKRDALASTGALDRCIDRIHEYLREIHNEHVQNVEREANERFKDDAEKWDRFFTAQSARWCPFSVNMLLHSMGNYLFKHMLQSSSYRSDLLVFDNVVLAAADTNSEEHAEWVDRIQCRGRIFITLNENDVALGASRMKMGEQQKARLGHYPHGLVSQRGVYVNFTGSPNVGDSHAYFEGDSLRNKRVRQFFDDALNGRRAEEGLGYDVARNMHLLQEMRRK
jgi:esterase/lipase superfamily enzyme